MEYGKVSALGITTNPAGGYIEVIIPNMAGSFDSKRISYEVLEALIASGVMLTSFTEIWVSLATGSVQVGNITTDDVIEIKGSLVAGVKKTKFTITITNDGTDCEIDYQMVPYVEEFQSIFTTPSIEGGLIMLNYDVGVQADSITIKGFIDTFNI
jgi:hypothetical protein